MRTAGASARRRAALRPTRPWNGILAKFLLLLTPVFLAFAIPGIGFIVHYKLSVDEETLAALSATAPRALRSHSGAATRSAIPIWRATRWAR